MPETRNPNIEEQLQELRQRAMSQVKSNKKKLTEEQTQKTELRADKPDKQEAKPQENKKDKEETREKPKADISSVLSRKDDAADQKAPVSEPEKEKPEESKTTAEPAPQEKPKSVTVYALEKFDFDDGFEDEPEDIPAPAAASDGNQMPGVPDNVPTEENKKTSSGFEKDLKNSPEFKKEESVKKKIEETSEKRKDKSETAIEKRTESAPRHAGPHYISKVKRKVIYIDSSSGRHLDRFRLVQTSTGEEFPLQGSCTLGRQEPAEIVINNTDDCRFISAEHARIICEGGLFFIQDNNSRNGTFVNSIRLKEPRIQIYPGDRIKLGKETFIFDAEADDQKKPAREYAPVSLIRKDTGEVYDIFDNMKIGRAEDNDICIPEPDGHFVTSYHAVITIDKNDIRLRDLGSTNGTFVGSSRIKTKSLYKGTIVRFANIEFEVIER